MFMLYVKSDSDIRLTARVHSYTHLLVFFVFCFILFFFLLIYIFVRTAVVAGY